MDQVCLKLTLTESCFSNTGIAGVHHHTQLPGWSFCFVHLFCAYEVFACMCYLWTVCMPDTQKGIRSTKTGVKDSR